MTLKGIVSAAAMLLLTTGPALAGTTIVVGNCPGGTNETIQEAINAASPGTLIKVCPGAYAEQLEINKNVSLEGIADNGAAIIVPPNTGLAQNATSLSSGELIAAQIFVHDATAVHLKNLTVDGANNQISGCSLDPIGIFYQNASGTVTGVALRNQKLAPSDAGCQGGLGLYVQSGKSGQSVVTVTDSSVHDYQKNGITGNDPGTRLIARGNLVRGQGPTNGAAENGIQIGFGATGLVEDNVVIDDIWAPDTSSDTGDAAAGILVYDSADVKTVNNVVGNTQFGIVYVTDTSFPGLSADGGTIASNTVLGTSIFDGIDICSNHNSVTHNVVYDSDESGIHLDSSCGTTGNDNHVLRNTINEACAAILDGGSGNVTSGNVFLNDVYTILTGNTCSSPLMSSAQQATASVLSGGSGHPHPYR